VGRLDLPHVGRDEDGRPSPCEFVVGATLRCGHPTTLTLDGRPLCEPHRGRVIASRRDRRSRRPVTFRHLRAACSYVIACRQAGDQRDARELLGELLAAADADRIWTAIYQLHGR
jgi:hypothetical protein